MQPSGRTPSSILRSKRPSQDEQNRRRSIRAKGRRVSFAPDEELETRHLFNTDKNSPLPATQDTQPLAELQNLPAGQALPGAQQQQHWGSFDKPAAQPQYHHGGHADPDLLMRQQHLGQPDSFLLASPAPPSEVSMELTNDTLQGPGGPFGMARGGGDESDSLTLNAVFGGAAAAGGAGARDLTHNITNDIPGLSTLVEEDEELDAEGSLPGDDETGGVAMDLTGTTVVPGGATPAAAEPASQTKSPATRRRSRSTDAPAASPAVTPGQRRSSRRLSQDAGAASPAVAAVAAATASPASRTPRGGRSRGRSSGAAATASPEVAAQEQPEAPASASRRRSGSGAGSALKAPAPGPQPTPSPLRRVTRSMKSPLASPLSGDAAGTAPAGPRPASASGSDASLSLSEGGFTEGLEAAAGRSLSRFNEQQSRWGLVPGQDDTLDINMGLGGAGGLGDATLHHVYAEGAGTGELTRAMQPGQPLGAAAAAAPAAAPRAGARRRSSVGRRGRASLAAEVIPEEAAVTPQMPGDGGDDAAAAAATPAPAPRGDDDGAPTLGGATPGLLGSAFAPSPDPAVQQQHLRMLQQQRQTRRSSAALLLDSPLLGSDAGSGYDVAPGSAAHGGAAPDGDGLTTNLLLEEDGRPAALPGWGHVPLGGADAPDAPADGRPSLPAGGMTAMTGRGSVGSNMLTLHTHRFGGQTTQLLAGDSAQKGAGGAPPAPGARASAAHAPRRASAAAGGAAGGAEDCTTKLLADSTSASACGVMSLVPPQPRAALLSSTIAGGAPVVQPAPGGGVFGSAAAAAPAFGSDAPVPAPAAPAPCAPPLAAAAAGSPYAAAAADGSPLGHWQQQQGRSPSASPLGLAAAGVSPAVLAAGDAQQGSEPTLELAAGVSQGLLGGGGGASLEDATLEDFALPPEMAAAEERPITMPFSSVSGALAGAAAGGAGTGSIAVHTPGGSLARAAQPLTFSDFCQVVDVQFITNIRRGTSISVADLAPSAAPADLGAALSLVALTSSEIAVLEGAMHELQGEMAAKRRDAYEQEERLGAENPPVFAAVQTARPTQLEQTKHCLILMRKACRAQTMAAWKRLRCAMEQQLAERLAQQQADLDEQLAFVQAKLQTAQQQREYARAFHADVLRGLAADEAARQEATAARARLACLRRRLEELRALNADRQARAAALHERLGEAEARRSDAAAQLAALRARREELAAQLAATPQPAASARVVRKLQAADERLSALGQIQGCRLLAGADGSWTLSFRDAVGIAIGLQDGGAEGARATGGLVLLPSAAAPSGNGGAAALNGPLAQQLLRSMVDVLQPRLSFAVAPAMLPAVLTEGELVLGRALEVAEACQELFLAQPLLTGVGLESGVAGAAFGGGAASEAVACLGLTLVEADQQLKVQLLLPLADLTAHSHPGAGKRLRTAVQVLVAPSDEAAAALQQQVQQRLQAALAAAAGARAGNGSAASLLPQLCAAAADCLAGDDMVPATQ